MKGLKFGLHIMRGIPKPAVEKNLPIANSTSPGATPLDQGAHVMTNANLWRLSGDFWNDWKALKEQFARVDNWTRFRGAGHWPDADMLPLGTGVMAVPSVIYTLACLIIPESPRWLIGHKEDRAAGTRVIRLI